MSELVNQYKTQTVAYFAIHSYSQLWMYPYGYKTALPTNAAKLKEISQAGIAAIKATGGLTFTEGPIATAICEYSPQHRFFKLNFLPILNIFFI